MKGNQRVNCGAMSVYFNVIILLWMAVLCTDIQTSVPKLTGRRTVSKQNSSLPRRRSSEI
ncbi:unnamed protein product, partial [Staurois parvus]